VSPTVLGHGEDTQVAMNAPPTLPLTVAEIMELFENPLHPYTNVLLSVVPAVEKIILTGTVSTLIDSPGGYRFHSRCFRGRYARRNIRFIIRIMSPTIRPHTCLRCQCPSLMLILYGLTRHLTRLKNSLYLVILVLPNLRQKSGHGG